MAAGTERHRVTAAMIVVRVPGAQGGEVYLRRGNLLPASVTDTELDRLTVLGLIEPVTSTESAAEPATTADAESASGPSTTAQPGKQGGDAPAQQPDKSKTA